MNQSAIVDDQPYELSVLTNSAISDFKMDEEKKQISLKVEGEPNTIGSTELELSSVLKCPYNVLVDGTIVEDTFLIEDTTTGKTILSFSYPHSTHEITITGTNVVPEFGSVAGLWMTDRNSYNCRPNIGKDRI